MIRWLQLPKEVNTADFMSEVERGRRQGYNKALADVRRMNQELLDPFEKLVGVGVSSVEIDEIAIHSFHGDNHPPPSPKRTVWVTLNMFSGNTVRFSCRYEELWERAEAIACLMEAKKAGST